MAEQSNTSLVVRVPEGGSPKLVLEDLPVPSPASGQVLVKLSHVAQNPTDVQAFDSNAFGDGAVLGCDFVGEVVKLGDGVTRLVKGDVVAGLIWGGEFKGLGGYSTYSLADEKICFKLPAGLSREHASTVPLAATTAWLALYSKDSLNIDRNKTGTSILVWGGSSSVGLYTVQLASLHGLEVIATCSPRHADLVRSYGAKRVFDYRDEQVIGKIHAAAPNLRYAFDTIGNESSSTLASQASSGENWICTVRPGKAHTQNVSTQTHVSDVLVWTAFLKEHRYGEFYWPTSKHDHELGSELFEKLPGWLSQGTIKPSEPKVYQGLKSVAGGFQEHREGKISGYKIVYKL
ncbi:zinc-binding alcohol dehydrogenase family protein [Aspergillus affinis]|uniref:zinc-binding alcohol dehydrogenase family protein n=1 Tax=Aspergillus affinis TaxID=1070780 RepID=UPI0022FE941C|nr:putative zinc-binding dehydrogenase family oxidoreductase [Aspergillus affinis]KAI9037607.1 putative zinc-binding dehydrogenase family oxidoreductase [Aspergillus affinis]